MTPPGGQPPETELPLTFRPIRTRLVLMALGAAVFVVLAVIGLMVPQDSDAGWGPGEQLAFAFSGLLVWGVLALLSRPKAVASAEGLSVTNLTTRRQLEWPEVVKVNLRSGDPWASLDLHDGSTLPVMAIQPGNGREKAVRDARRLRDLAEHYGTARSDH